MRRAFCKVLNTDSNSLGNDLLSDVKFGDAGSDLLDDTNPLMTENASINYHREISLKNMQIGPANRRSGNPHNGIG